MTLNLETLAPIINIEKKDGNCIKQPQQAQKTPIYRNPNYISMLNQLKEGHFWIKEPNEKIAIIEPLLIF